MTRDGSSTRERILAAAETLVLDKGFSATTVDEVIAASASSKGSFFHHFTSKAQLGEALVARYAEADMGHLQAALDAVARFDQPAERVLAFLDVLADGADELMSAQSGCLYAAMLAEHQLLDEAARKVIGRSVVAWRAALAADLRAALGRPRRSARWDYDALADHLFVTFEGAFVLCRATGDPRAMRRQLETVRALYASVLNQP